MRTRADGAGRGQHGVAALELALVLVLLLAILYGIASFGAVLLVQQNLTRAAGEGARALLDSRVPLPGPGGTAPCSVDPVLAEAVMRPLAWLDDFRARAGLAPLACEVRVQACPWAQALPHLRCAEVIVRYDDYRRHPLIPAVLPLARLMGEDGGWLPRELDAVAVAQFEPLLP